MPIEPVSAPAPTTRRRPSVPLLVAATALGPLALNIFVPSMPGLVASLNTDVATVQLTLTLYMIGLAGAQLAYGPISDRWGRRPTLLAGLAIFAAASLLCLTATDILALAGSRALQAVGGCAGMVIGRAIVRDVWGRDQAASIIGYMMSAVAIAPAVAPALGGLLDEVWGWRASFALLFLFGLAVLAAGWRYLPETHVAPGPPAGLGGYGRLLGSRAFLAYALCGAFTAAGFFAFLAGAPFVFATLLKRPPSAYGLYWVVVSVGYMVGSFVAGRMSAQLGVPRMIAAGVGLSALGALILIGCGLAGWLHPIALFGPMTVIAFGNALSQPSSMAGAVSIDPALAGTASGVAGCLQMLVGALAAAVVGLLENGTQWPMVAVMGTAITLAAATLPLTGRDRTLRPAPR